MLYCTLLIMIIQYPNPEIKNQHLESSLHSKVSHKIIAESMPSIQDGLQV